MSPHVKVLDPSDPASVQLCREIFEAALEADFRDDRLGNGVGEICLVGYDGDTPIGFCMGTPGSGPSVDLDLVVVGGNTNVANSLWEAAVNAAVETSDATPQLWGRPAQPYHDELAAEFKLLPSRELYQMRAPLPIDVDPVATRSFRPGVDDAAWIEVNNASFARHPDQGSYTQADLEKRMSEPWFDADGFRLFFDDDQLAGFCWTKIHQRAQLADLGEIYVIGLAPSHHGQGLGVPMTAAGLSWLSQQGLETAMLYVEANNSPAVATYERLGFSVFATYKAWHVA